MRNLPSSLGLRIAALLLPIAAASRAVAQSPGVTLSAEERVVARTVDAENARSLALLQRIVDINSGTMNFAGVRRVADVLRVELDSLGFTTRWVDGASFRRAGHLVAEHTGPGPKILLIGHLDTVFEPSSPFQKFERLDDSTARGPGVIDMKGGDVIIVAALRALKSAGLLAKLNVTVVYDGDEEDAGNPLTEARRTLIEAARGATAAIGFEDGPGDPHLAVISRRGDESWTLRTTGTPAHSSQIFQKEVGAGAVYEATRVLSEFYRQLSGERYLTFNPGLALGGTAVKLDSTAVAGAAEGKSNVVAEHMTVVGDLRTISPEQLTRAKQTMQTIVAAHLPNTSGELTFDPGYPPMAPSAGNRRLLTLYDRISRDLGLWPVAAVDPSKAGAADVSFVADIAPMKIDGVGLSGHDDHTTKETADLRMLPVQTKRAAILLYRLSTKPQEASDR
jgi:glutamate carboxypeptidase